MASKSKREQMAPQRNLAKTFMYWAIAILVVKLVIIFNIQALPLNETWGKDFLVGGIWPGSDAENYLSGYINLIKDGIFSTESILSYFPAGYPLIILFLSILSMRATWGFLRELKAWTMWTCTQVNFSR